MPVARRAEDAGPLVRLDRPGRNLPVELFGRFDLAADLIALELNRGAVPLDSFIQGENQLLACDGHAARQDESCADVSSEHAWYQDASHVRMTPGGIRDGGNRCSGLPQR